MLVNVVLLWPLHAVLPLAAATSCGGSVRRFSQAPGPLPLWSCDLELNERTMRFAWLSLFCVGLTDLYVRLSSMGVIRDLRISSDGRQLETLTDATQPRSRYDVLVIGAGGAGPPRRDRGRAARARETALVCKSLLGKAHTVMAEGGIAAALGNVWPEDNWQVHFRDTMRGGKMLNNWRMAQLHAQEAPERVRELEEWGALFDRTKDGLIRQRDFGGHRYARLAHVGDRTGLEMIRTLQHHAVAARASTSTWSARSPACSRTATGSPARSATGARPASSSPSRRQAIVLATGGIGKACKITSNSWEYTGDGHALACAPAPS